MTVIGLTGGIAAGKSTAAEALTEMGAIVIDADRIGHRSYEPGTPGFEKVVNAFGHDIVGKDGLVDRRVGRPSPRRAPEEELQRMLRLYHEYYQGFRVRHFHDKLRQRHEPHRVCRRLVWLSHAAAARS